MASPEILDFEQLVAPIEGELAVGSDLRVDTSPTSLYYQVKDVRSTARAAERQAVMNGDNGAIDAEEMAGGVPGFMGGGRGSLGVSLADVPVGLNWQGMLLEQPGGGRRLTLPTPRTAASSSTPPTRHFATATFSTSNPASPLR